VTVRPIPISEKAAALLTVEAKALLGNLAKTLEADAAWTAASLEAAVRQFSEQEKVKLGQIAQPLRAALTGSTTSPGIFEVMEILGRSECLGRLADALSAG
jgi:glutamyl-tRNA synthetase